ncbi:MAG: phosphatase PAP2 family protein, partial [Deltaproteobacteria bacterium]|nr:phosphatase PAP2 family protein [Deltaproteobacteria bacterium]
REGGPTFATEFPDAALTGLGLWASGIGVGLQSELWGGGPACGTPIGDQNLCDENTIYWWDRPTYGHYWSAAAPISDALLLTMLIAPTAYAGARAGVDDRLEDPGDAFGRSAAVSFQIQGATLLATNMLKLLIRRPRPFTYDPVFPEEARYRADARLSFPSGHSSLAFASASLLTIMILQEVDDEAAAAAAITAAYGVAATVGYLRIASRRHFISDVIVGAALGSGIAHGLGWLQVANPRDRTDGTTAERRFVLTWGGMF